MSGKAWFSVRTNGTEKDQAHLRRLAQNVHSVRGVTTCDHGRSAVRVLHFSFIGRGAVKGRDGELVQPQIDAELGAVMDHVVHHAGAQDGRARQAEDGSATEMERPGLPQVLVGRTIGWRVKELQRQVPDLAFPFSWKAEFRQEENVFDRGSNGNGRAHFEDSRHCQPRIDPLVRIAR